MNNTTTEIKAIVSKRLAVYLINNGFDLIDVQPSMVKQGYIVFLFNECPELEHAIDDYASKYSKPKTNNRKGR
ncbi:hypothetical protein SAMN02910447_03006 [Ruminococcus sp. YE71]|uniref:DUF5659 domain-containing protein n=1 Tax=unclassified Ruminococcus TaxID=2608920 RepID=UPI000880CBA8|nr:MULTISPECIES: DUF5659 domain-containing protein [unclassified Ruminococcus]SDA29259.1 hypothetical protein SAMN02910446_03077 [Ruminococcus sp. YE78]SFW47868.1 hypothetical protein SAMN02910447_03006 [Ruminococcus sp. YE71]